MFNCEESKARSTYYWTILQAAIVALLVGVEFTSIELLGDELANIGVHAVGLIKEDPTIRTNELLALQKMF